MMNTYSLIFVTLALSAMIGSLMVITTRNPVISVFFLILSFIATAGILLLSGIEFVPMTFIILYVGAIAILFLFVVMMLDIKLVDVIYSKSHFLIIICIFIIMLLLDLYSVLSYNESLRLNTIDYSYLIQPGIKSGELIEITNLFNKKTSEIFTPLSFEVYDKILVNLHLNNLFTSATRSGNYSEIQDLYTKMHELSVEEFLLGLIKRAKYLYSNMITDITYLPLVTAIGNLESGHLSLKDQELFKNDLFGEMAHNRFYFYINEYLDNICSRNLTDFVNQTYSILKEVKGLNLNSSLTDYNNVKLQLEALPISAIYSAIENLNTSDSYVSILEDGVCNGNYTLVVNNGTFEFKSIKPSSEDILENIININLYHSLNAQLLQISNNVVEDTMLYLRTFYEADNIFKSYENRLDRLFVNELDFKDVSSITQIVTTVETLRQDLFNLKFKLFVESFSDSCTSPDITFRKLNSFLFDQIQLDDLVELKNNIYISNLHTFKIIDTNPLLNSQDFFNVTRNIINDMLDNPNKYSPNCVNYIKDVFVPTVNGIIDSPSVNNSIDNSNIYYPWDKVISQPSNIQNLGQVLYTVYVLLFIVAGIILLVAMIGAIVLTLYKPLRVKRQDIFNQITRFSNKSHYLKK